MFGSDLEHILYIMDIISLPIGQQLVTIQDTTKFQWLAEVW